MVIPKGGGDFQGTGPTNVLWNTLVVILKRCLGETIILHNILHEFWDGRGTGTASLEAKLLQQLMAKS